MISVLRLVLARRSVAFHPPLLPSRSFRPLSSVPTPPDDKPPADPVVDSSLKYEVQSTEEGESNETGASSDPAESPPVEGTSSELVESTETSVSTHPSTMETLPPFLTVKKLESPSAERNKEPIWKVVEANVLPLIKRSNHTLRVLEAAGGCGVHTQYLGSRLLDKGLDFVWYPTDPERASRLSQEAYIAELPSLQDKTVKPESLTFDAEGAIEGNVPVDLDLIVCINMVHISPWGASIGLMKVAGESLRPGGILYLYGPYRVRGKCVESNQYVLPNRIEPCTVLSWAKSHLRHFQKV